MARNYAAVPHEYLEEMEQLTDQEFGRLIRALLRYSRDGVVAQVEGNERFYLKRIMAQENRCQDHYEQLSRIRSQAGKKGAESRWQNRDTGESAPVGEDGKHGKNGNTKSKTNSKSNMSMKDMAFEKKVMEDALRLKQWCQEQEGGVQEENGAKMRQDRANIAMDNGEFFG